MTGFGWWSRAARTALMGIAALAITAAVAERASAQGADERARTHFESGRLHFEEGAYDRAREEFLRAWELSRRPALLLNLATTEERLALYDEAVARIRDYLAAVLDDPNRDQLQRRVENLERLMRERGAAATPAADPNATATTTPAPSGGGGGGGGGDGLVIGGIVGLGVGGAGFVLQGVFGGLALAEDGRLAEGCGANGSCSEAEVADANTFAAVSDAMMGIGIAGVAAGAVLLILGLTSGGSSNDTAQVIPYGDQTGAGVVVQVGL